MLRHVALFQFADGTTEEQKAAVRDALDRLPELIPQIRSYRFGDDLGLREGNFEFAVTADFDRGEDFIAYRDHPDHQKTLVELIAPIVTNRAAVQFEWRPSELRPAWPTDLPG